MRTSTAAIVVAQSAGVATVFPVMPVRLVNKMTELMLTLFVSCYGIIRALAFFVYYPFYKAGNRDWYVVINVKVGLIMSIICFVYLVIDLAHLLKL